MCGGPSGRGGDHKEITRLRGLVRKWDLHGNLRQMAEGLEEEVEKPEQVKGK